MKIAYFDLIGGASGDMILSSFIECGFKRKNLETILKELGLKDINISFRKLERAHIKATRIEFLDKKKRRFRYKEIIKKIHNASFSKMVKERAISTYEFLREVEAKVHGHKPENLEFKHLAEADALLEIISFWKALEDFKIEKVFSSVFPVSKSGGATLEILKKKGKKISPVNYNYETLTPTGAVLLAEASQEEITFIPENIGYGAGSFDIQEPVPDLLRLIIGEEFGYSEDKLIKMEANIDDMNPQVFELLIDELLKEGALEVYLTSVVMKKSRPSFLLNVLTSPCKLTELSEIVLKKTTTFGIRFTEFKRYKLTSDFSYQDTSLGKVKFRKGYLQGKLIKKVPEYNDCKKIAEKYNISLLEVYRRLQSSSDG